MFIKSLLISFSLFFSNSFADSDSKQYPQHNCKEPRKYGFAIKKFSVLTEKSISYADRVLHIRNIDKIVCVEELAKNKYTRLWISSNQGEATILSFYQLDQIKSALFEIFSTEVIGEGIFSSIEMKDLDEDGVNEILVKQDTFSEWGTLYNPGKVQWVDIYKFKPLAALSNSEFIDFYKAKEIEIHKDITMLEQQSKKLLLEIEDTPDEDLSMFLEIKANGLKEVIKVYRKWLREIETLQNIVSLG